VFRQCTSLWQRTLRDGSLLTIASPAPHAHRAGSGSGYCTKLSASRSMRCAMRRGARHVRLHRNLAVWKRRVSRR